MWAVQVLQLATLMVSKHTVTEAQSLHSDVRMARRHLEIHIPLQVPWSVSDPHIVC